MEPAKKSSPQGSGIPTPLPSHNPVPDTGKTEGTISGADPVHQGDDVRVAALEAKVKELTEQLAKLTDLAARAQADLQNAKARMQKDGDDLRKFAAESFIRRLLPTVDHFQRAFAQVPKELAEHQWVKGIGAIERDFLKQMAEMGLKKMEVLGQQVDTARHEVILMGAGKEGEVLEVIEDGYELNGRILRPAKVKVGDGTTK